MSEGQGIVYLVGAGPGDPGLMTIRSLELLVAADVIVHDRLIPADALGPARPGAELVYVGKAPGDASVPQDEIGELLVDRARQGKIVVRLKGGDPFVFGRGGEEAEALAEAGIPFEVVPGITAGVAASAYAGIPVTHRDDASAVAFVTGHEDPAKEDAAGAVDYDALASFPGTLVFYMGVKALPRIAERLVAAGRDPAEPAAVIERGTLPGQRTVSATARRAPRRGGDRGDPPARDHRRRPRRRPPRDDRLVRASPPPRRPRGRHPGPPAGERALAAAWRRWAPSRWSCPRSGSSRAWTPTRSAAWSRASTPTPSSA